MPTLPTIFGRRLIHFVIPFLLFTAWLLLLLVSLSLPIIKDIYLLQVSANLPPDSIKTSIATSLRFGLWGWCAGAYQFRTDHTVWVANGLCSKPEVGYTIDKSVALLLGDAGLVNILLKALTIFLVVHPICCGFVFLTLVGSLVRVWKPTLPHYVSICNLLLSILPTVLTTVVLIVDIVLVAIARTRVHDTTNGRLGVHWGNAVWMTAAAVFCLWVSLFGLSAIACGCCGCGWRENFVKRRRSQQIQEKI